MGPWTAGSTRGRARESIKAKVGRPDKGLYVSYALGLAISGNEVGLPLREWTTLPEADKQSRRQRAYQRMRQGGAHYAVDTIADVLPCIDAIESRLACGEKP